jgi:hypothetical protein
MKLMTKEILRLLPKLYANEGKPATAVKVPLKLFDPCGRLTFYCTEWDGEDILFGYMVSPLGEDCDELGYSSLRELSEVKGPLGLGIERDIHWDPDTTLAEAVPKLAEG